MKGSSRTGVDVDCWCLVGIISFSNFSFDPKPLETGDRPSFAPPKDRLLADVLHKNQDAITDYFQHDTLFAQVDEEKLSEEEVSEREGKGESWGERERGGKGVRESSCVSVSRSVAGLRGREDSTQTVRSIR